jgi:hypothetical protein
MVRTPLFFIVVSVLGCSRGSTSAGKPVAGSDSDSDSDADADADADADSDADWGGGSTIAESTADAHIVGTDSDYLGWHQSVSVGDLNGDGVDDLVAGGSYALTGGDGGVWVLDGAGFDSWGGPINALAFATIEGSADSSYFATMGARQGDQDDDGVADLLVAGTDVYSYSGDLGVYAASLFFGGAGSIEGDLTEADADVLFEGTTSGYWYVKALSSNDFDGDGLDDVVMGDFYSSSSTHGSVYFFPGSTLSPGGLLNLSDDGELEIYGDSAGDLFGYSLAGGDVDGDGFDELFAGSGGQSHGGMTRSGCVYMIGGNPGLGAGSESASSASSLKVCGIEPHQRVGRDGSPQLVDLDRDGSLDLVVSGPGAASGGTEDGGRVWAYFDVASLSGTLTTDAADLTLYSGAAAYFGSAVHHGDFNGDGNMELAVGASESTTYDDEMDGPGEVFFYRFSTLAGGGLLSSDDADLHILGEGQSGFGGAIVSADFNGDGAAELIVAAHRYEDEKGRLSIFNLK